MRQQLEHWSLGEDFINEINFIHFYFAINNFFFILPWKKMLSCHNFTFSPISGAAAAGALVAGRSVGRPVLFDNLALRLIFSLTIFSWNTSNIPQIKLNWGIKYFKLNTSRLVFSLKTYGLFIIYFAITIFPPSQVRQQLEHWSLGEVSVAIILIYSYIIYSYIIVLYYSYIIRISSFC